MGYIDSKTPRGPARWKRASDNAAKYPNSKNAKLYKTRVATAGHATADVYEETIARFGRTGPFDFRKFEYKYAIAYDTGKIKYRTCSLHCTGLQLQLDEPIQIRTAGDLTTLLRGIIRGQETGSCVRMTPLGAMKQPVRCQVCGSTILPPTGDRVPTQQSEPKPDASKELAALLKKLDARNIAEDAAAAEVAKKKEITVPKTRTAELHPYVVNPSGELETLENLEIKVLWLTPAHADMISGYVSHYEMDGLVDELGEVLDAETLAEYLK